MSLSPELRAVIDRIKARRRGPFFRFRLDFPAYGPFRSMSFGLAFFGLFIEYYENDLCFMSGKFVSGCRIAVFNPFKWRDIGQAIRFLHVFVDDLRIVGDEEAPERVAA